MYSAVGIWAKLWIHSTPPSIFLSLPLTGRHGVESPVDEHAEARLAEPAQASIVFGLGFRLGRKGTTNNASERGHCEEGGVFHNVSNVAKPATQVKQPVAHELASSSLFTCFPRMSMYFISGTTSPMTNHHLLLACFLPVKRIRRKHDRSPEGMVIWSIGLFGFYSLFKARSWAVALLHNLLDPSRNNQFEIVNTKVVIKRNAFGL